MKIRPYRKGDFPFILKVWAETGMNRPDRGDDENTVELTVLKGGTLLVLYDETAGDRIVGTSWITFDGRRMHMHHFGIIPEYQGQGHSRLLMRDSLRFVKEKGIQVKIEVHKSNSVALDIYKKAGFRYLGDYEIYIIRDIQSIEL